MNPELATLPLDNLVQVTPEFVEVQISAPKPSCAAASFVPSLDDVIPFQSFTLPTDVSSVKVAPESVEVQKKWSSITSSSDGTKLAAVVQDGNIWTQATRELRGQRTLRSGAQKPGTASRRRATEPNSPLWNILEYLDLLNSSVATSSVASSAPPPPMTCPTSISEYSTACSDTAYTGAIFTGTSICTCRNSLGNSFVFNDCVDLNPSPPPPSPPSPPPAESDDTSDTDSFDTDGNCRCSCCTGNYCTRTVVGSYDASSSSACSSSDCRSQFGANCPGSGQSGSVVASYSSVTTDTSPSPPPPALVAASASNKAQITSY